MMMKALLPVAIVLLVIISVSMAVLDRAQSVSAAPPEISAKAIDDNFAKVQIVFKSYNEKFEMLAKAIDEHTEAIKELQGKKKK